MDGLRALAVLLVILFHLSPRLAPNGFVGVDVFFVISGFVVTASMSRKAGNSLRSSVYAFWRRRVFRIYPALLLCLLLTLLATYIVTPPFPLVVYQSVLRTALSSVIGAANLYLFRSQQDYFTASPSLNPFLHMWSLGVEEQFYLLFSALFILGPALLTARSEVASRSFRRIVFLGLTVASFGVLAAEWNRESLASYYLLQFRFWEIGLGCSLALCPGDQAAKQAARPGSLRTNVGWAALLAIVVISLWSSPGSQNPPIVGATLATAVLIWSNGVKLQSRWSSAVLLSHPIAQRLGQISYSLYLWHWPVFALWRVTFGLRSPVTIATALAAIFLLSLGSFVFVERPFRQAGGRVSQLHGLALATFVLAVCALTLVGMARPGALYAGAPQAWAGEWLPNASFPYAPGGRLKASECDLGTGPIPIDVPVACTHPPAPGRPSVLLVGDSIAFADWGMLAGLSQLSGYGWSSLTHDGCNIAVADAQATPSCREYWATMAERIRRSVRPGDIVMVANLWRPRPPDLSLPFGRLEQIATASGRAGGRLVVQAPPPQFERDAFLCSPEWFRRDYSGCTVQKAAFEAARAPVMAGLRTLVLEHRGVIIWDPLSLLCPGDTCRQFSGSHPLFRNWDHLSFWGSASLAPGFAAFIYTLPQMKGLDHLDLQTR